MKQFVFACLRIVGSMFAYLHFKAHEEQRLRRLRNLERNKKTLKAVMDEYGPSNQRQIGHLHPHPTQTASICCPFCKEQHHPSYTSCGRPLKLGDRLVEEFDAERPLRIKNED